MSSDKHRTYSRIVRFVSETPWAMLPSALAEILDLVEFRTDGNVLSDEEIVERIQAASYAGKRGKQPQATGVAVIPVYGAISPKMDMMTQISGGTSMDQFCAALMEACNNPDVGSIMLAFDTPGGAVPGVPEAAAMIRSAKQRKPVVAMVDSMAASAGYWLASQASEIVVTPSGEVGSIGVFAAHTDVSGAMEAEGMKKTLISAGKYKTELSPFAPLSEEGRAVIQKNVDHYYSMFTADVAKGRGTKVSDVRGGFGEGRMVTAPEAVQMGMADSVGTIGDTLNRMLSAVTSHSGTGASHSQELVTANTYLMPYMTTTSGTNTAAINWNIGTSEEDTTVSEEISDEPVVEEHKPQRTLAELRSQSREAAISGRETYLDLLRRINE